MAASFSNSQGPNYLNFFYIILLAASFIVISFFISSIFLLNSKSINDTLKIFEINKGQSKTLIINQLQSNDLISFTQNLGLQFLVRINPKLEIQAGEYEFLPHTPLKKILDKLKHGKVKLYSLTIIEGSNSFDLARIIFNHSKINNTYSSLSALEKYLLEFEGKLLPETYFFPKNSKDLELIANAEIKMQEFLRSLNINSEKLIDLLILASIIEKETGLNYERELVSAVLHNRLAKKMRLQTDPTVWYGLIKYNLVAKDSSATQLSKKLLKIDTPYNTYLHKGLPSGPIAMPSKAAILAALNPSASDYLYFVAKGDGSHYFSKTLAEHNQAVKKYILNINNQNQKL